ncbi:zinc finger protein 862-like [Acropora palmata]|uniref:zinc finger protein 862-like n=1 Tax=Acropora palmata TaxID=6131 RepID=UPI003DA128D9
MLTQLSRDVLKSKFYSILFDSTTDKTVSEQEAEFVLYFEPDPTEPQLSGDHEPMVHVKLGFLSLENLTNSTAQGVVEGIKTSLKNLGLPNVGEIPPIPVGLGWDGCSTNRGETNGVQALFKKEYSWCLFVWCVAHRLELALKDALSNTYFKKVDEVLLRLYYLYENSPKKLRGLKELHLAYKDTFQFAEGSVKPKRASGTRWISHKLAALKLLVDKFGLFIQHLETLSSDRSVKSSDQAKSKGYLKEWKSAKLFVYSCFFVDLLQPAAVLSQTF